MFPFRKKSVSKSIFSDHESDANTRRNSIETSRVAKWAEQPPRPPLKSRKIPIKKFILVFLGAAFLFAAMVGYASYRSYSERYALDTEKARDALPTVGRDTAHDTPKNPLDIWNTTVLPFLTRGQSTLSDLHIVATNASTLLGDVTFFEQDALHDMASGQGGAVIDHLAEAHDALHILAGTKDGLKVIVPLLGMSADSASINTQLSFLDGFSGALANWMRGEHHMLVFFGNTSEIRPGGGFIGSYADVTFRGGNIVSTDVHDINDADRAFHKNVVPPYPLQSIESRWHIADTNWFLNFPDSARTLISFFNDTQATSAPAYDAAVAITPKVIEDMLVATGPITLKSGLVITESNFMREIQASVEANQAKYAAHPKNILAELEPLLFQKFTGLSQDAQPTLISQAQDWLLKKDVMFYFVDPHLQNFAIAFGWTGEMFTPAADFKGDYFALSGANIGGGKTDLLIDTKVSLQSRIAGDGTVYDHVALTRTHNGNKETQWWYRLPNEAYIEVYAMPASTLSDAQGGFWKKITPSVNYNRAGYLAHPLVSSTESTARSYVSYPQVRAYQTGGLRAFGTWSKVAIGKTDKLSMDYTHKLFVPPTDGLVYTFVFDKQPGTVRHYEFDISAPSGFIFRESGLPVLDYKTDDPPGRLTINLTLKKI